MERAGTLGYGRKEGVSGTYNTEMQIAAQPCRRVQCSRVLVHTYNKKDRNPNNPNKYAMEQKAQPENNAISRR
jgi:hypothetical protein